MVAKSVGLLIRTTLPLIAVVVSGCGPHRLVGGGLGWIDYGGEEGGTLTPLLGARIGVPEKGAAGVLALDLQPIPVPASGSYKVSTFLLVPSLEGRIGSVAVAGGVGYEENLYSSDVTAHQKGNLTGGLAVRFSFSLCLPPRGRTSAAAEAFTTLTGDPSRQEGAVITGAQLMKYL